MNAQRPPSAPGPTPPSQDPWQAFSYLVTGVLVYGLIGYGVDRWLGTRGFVVLGITVGAGLGIYLVFKKFGHDPGDTRHDHSHTT